MKKILLFFALLLVLAGAGGYLLAPEFSADLLKHLPIIGKGSGPVTLTYWGLWEEKQIIQPLIDDYQRQHPNIIINYEERDPQNHFQTVRSRLQGGGAPDIVRVHLTWVPFIKNYLTPVPKKILDSTTYEELFYPVNQKMLKFEDKYYAIPLMYDGLALVYNQDLLERAGISTPPRTWDVFRETVNTLTRRDVNGNLVQSGAAFGFAKNIDYFSDILGLMLAQNGVKFMDANGQVTFHNSISPDGRNLGAEALQFYTLFAQGSPVWDNTWENSTDAFIHGKVAMVFLPSHRILKILNRNPSFRVGVAPAPQLPNVKPGEGTTWANYWVEVVPKKSENTREAWKFLVWLTQQKQLSKFYRLASNLRAFGEPYSRTDMAQDLASDKYTYPYVSQAPNATTWFFSYGTHDGILNDRIVNALETAVENTAAGRTSPTDALGSVAAVAQETINSLQHSP